MTDPLDLYERRFIFMTMEEFVMLIDDSFGDFRDNYYPKFMDRKMRKREFRRASNYRWALNELIISVDNEIPNSWDPFPITRFIDAVVGFEYDMDVFSKVSGLTRIMFEDARDIAASVEDVLNAML